MVKKLNITEWTGNNYSSGLIPVYSTEGYRKLKEYVKQLDPDQVLIMFYTYDSLGDIHPYDKKRKKYALNYHPEWFEIGNPIAQVDVLFVRNKAEKLFRQLEKKALSLAKETTNESVKDTNKVIRKLRINESSRPFDCVTDAVDYYYRNWVNGFVSNEEIRMDLKKKHYSDDFIDSVFETISDRYEDEERYDYEHDYD